MKTVKSTLKIFLLLGLFTGACEKQDQSPKGIEKEYKMPLVSGTMI